jgi:hypothetical protein
MSSYSEKLAELQRLRNEVRRLEQLADREAKSMTPLSLDDEHRMVAAQSRADELYRGAGRLPAPPAEPHERPSAYERRLAAGLAVYSPRWSKANLERMPDDAFAIARDQIYADAAQNAKTHGLQARQLKPIPTRTASGHESVEWAGGDGAWFGRQFERPVRRAQFQAPEQYAAMSRDGQLSRITELARYGQRPIVQAPTPRF